MKVTPAHGEYSASPSLPTIPGSQLVVKLILQEVSAIIGYLGASVLPLFDRFHNIIEPSDRTTIHI